MSKTVYEPKFKPRTKFRCCKSARPKKVKKFSAGFPKSHFMKHFHVPQASRDKLIQFFKQPRVQEYINKSKKQKNKADQKFSYQQKLEQQQKEWQVMRDRKKFLDSCVLTSNKAEEARHYQHVIDYLMMTEKSIAKCLEGVKYPESSTADEESPRKHGGKQSHRSKKGEKP